MDPHQTKILAAILIAGISLGGIILAFIIFVVKHQKRKANLYKEKLVAEITTLERERKRMALDLHDDVGPTLSLIKLQVTSLQCPGKNNCILIEDMSKNLDAVISNIRQTSNNLRPLILDRKGLSMAIEEFVYTVTLVNAVAISYNGIDTPLKIDNDKEIHVFRIVQEIVNNALKHAAATHIGITLSIKRNVLAILIEDNGSGFDVDLTRNHGKGLGLYNIYSRVEYLEGDISLKSTLGSGSQYSIEIPLTQ